MFSKSFLFLHIKTITSSGKDVNNNSLRDDLDIVSLWVYWAIHSLGLRCYCFIKDGCVFRTTIRVQEYSCHKRRIDTGMSTCDLSDTDDVSIETSSNNMTISRGGTFAVTGLETAVDNIADWLFESEGTAGLSFLLLSKATFSGHWDQIRSDLKQ